MENEDYMKEVIQSEGFKIDPYMDEGKVAGGIGHNFTEETFREYNPEWTPKEKQEYWLQKFDEDWSKAMAQATKDAQDFEVPPSPQMLLVLTELKFNMGDTGFSREKWPNFYEAASKGNYQEAAKELLTGSKGGKSKWSKDVGPNRSERIANVIRSS